MYRYLYTCLWTTCISCPWRPEEEIASPGAKVTEGPWIEFSSSARAAITVNPWAISPEPPPPPHSHLFIIYLFTCVGIQGWGVYMSGHTRGQKCVGVRRYLSGHTCEKGRDQVSGLHCLNRRLLRFSSEHQSWQQAPSPADPLQPFWLSPLSSLPFLSCFHSFSGVYDPVHNKCM